MKDWVTDRWSITTAGVSVDPLIRYSCRVFKENLHVWVMNCEPPVRGGELSSALLTWSLITMGLPPSRSLKLLRPRLAEDPPLSAGPGPSLPDRSGRIRIGPLLITSGERFQLISLHILEKKQSQCFFFQEYFSPHLSLVGVHPSIILPPMASVSGWAVVWHAGHRRSGSHRPIVHGHRSSLVSVPAVGVAEFGSRRRRGFGSAHRLKGLGVALEAGAFSVRSGAGFLHLRLSVKPVPSGNKDQDGIRHKDQDVWGQDHKVLSAPLPVVGVGLLGCSLRETPSVSRVEVWEAVLLPVVAGALVQTDVRLRLHLLVSIPVGIVSATETTNTHLMSSWTTGLMVLTSQVFCFKHTQLTPDLHNIQQTWHQNSNWTKATFQKKMEMVLFLMMPTDSSSHSPTNKMLNNFSELLLFMSQYESAAEGQRTNLCSTSRPLFRLFLFSCS